MVHASKRRKIITLRSESGPTHVESASNHVSVDTTVLLANTDGTFYLQQNAIGAANIVMPAWGVICNPWMWRGNTVLDAGCISTLGGTGTVGGVNLLTSTIPSIGNFSDETATHMADPDTGVQTIYNSFRIAGIKIAVSVRNIDELLMDTSKTVGFRMFIYWDADDISDDHAINFGGSNVVLHGRYFGATGARRRVFQRDIYPPLGGLTATALNQTLSSMDSRSARLVQTFKFPAKKQGNAEFYDLGQWIDVTRNNTFSADQTIGTFLISEATTKLTGVKGRFVVGILPITHVAAPYAALAADLVVFNVSCDVFYEFKDMKE